MTISKESTLKTTKQAHYQKRLFSLPFITGRGIVFLAFGLWLLLGPVRLESDVVASVFSVSLLILICVLCVASIICGVLTKRNFLLSVSTGNTSPQNSYTQLESGRPAVLVYKASPVSVPPFFVLRLKVEFQEEPLQTSTHLLTGKQKKSFFLNEALVFPHRGDWHISKVNYSFGDRFGLTCFNWSANHDFASSGFHIKPPPLLQSTLPVISSSRKSGEDLLDMTERQGEPFDLKPYHPSDGMKKILWKIYAKSGELISRHPERSMTPEGQVLLFALATRRDDATCSAALAYLKELEELDLRIMVGCLGMGSRPIAVSSGTAENLLIDSVWECENWNGAISDLGRLIEHARENMHASQIENVVFLVSRSCVSLPENIERVAKLGEYLGSQNISPVFALTNDRWAKYGEKQPRNAQKLGIWKKVLNWLVEIPSEALEQENPDIKEFHRVCALKSWRVII